MTEAVQTSGLTNPPTGKERLLAIARWLLAFLFAHVLIIRARELTAILRRHPGSLDDTVLARRFGTTDRGQIQTRVTRALRRATALAADLLARHPAGQGLPLASSHAVVAEIIAICRDLGIPLRARPAAARAISMSRRVFHPARATRTARRSQACPAIPPLATGPPGIGTGGFQTRPDSAATTTRVYPWSFSGRTPAFAV